MKDIFDIKGNLYGGLFSKNFYIYFGALLIVFLLVFVLSFLIDKLVKYIKKLNAKRLEKMILKKKYIEIISNIEKDKDFYKKLSFYTRDYFEKAKIITKPTKKTATELKSGRNKLLDDFFINCRDKEFNKEVIDLKSQEKLQNEAILIIQNNF